MNKFIIHHKVISAKVGDDAIAWLDPLGNKHSLPNTPDLRAIYLIPYPFDGDSKKKIIKLK